MLIFLTFAISLLTKWSFWSTANMGIEGYSKAAPLRDMNTLTGGRREYLWTALIFGVAIPLFAMQRKNGEDSIRSHVKTTNRYARLDLGREEAKLSSWTLGDARQI